MLGKRPRREFSDINSKIKGVQIGAITYSFNRGSSPDDIIKAYVSIGLGEMELMSNHAEALAGLPPSPARGAGNRGARGAALAAGGAGGAAGHSRRGRQSGARLAPGGHRTDVQAGAKANRRRGDRPPRRLNDVNFDVTDEDIEYRLQHGEVAGRQGPLHVDAGQHGKADGGQSRGSTR